MRPEPSSDYPAPFLFADLIDADRCPDVDDGYRCQLIRHDDGQHCAMTRFDVEPRRGMRRPKVSDYRTWGETWTKVKPGQGPLPWSVTFPRVES